MDAPDLAEPARILQSPLYPESPQPGPGAKLVHDDCADQQYRVVHFSNQTISSPVFQRPPSNSGSGGKRLSLHLCSPHSRSGQKTGPRNRRHARQAARCPGATARRDLAGPHCRLLFPALRRNHRRTYRREPGPIGAKHRTGLLHPFDIAILPAEKKKLDAKDLPVSQYSWHRPSFSQFLSRAALSNSVFQLDRDFD